MDSNFVNLAKDLVAVPQCAYNSQDPSATPVLLPDSAGLLTTRAWGVAHLYQGTNRRAIRNAAKVFLCKDITDLQDASMPDWHVRRDVDRAPGSNPTTYTVTCRGCHTGMDALAGAYAFFDSYYPNGMMPDRSISTASSTLRTFYINKAGSYTSDPCSGTSGAMPKVNRNCQVFPPGWVTGDDSWINFFFNNQNASLGWDTNTPMKGNGVHALGDMLANSAQFPACMAQRVFTQMCKRGPDTTEAAVIKNLADDFAASGYNMRRLYENAATLSDCLTIGGN
jgi:hypothetical protein